MGKHPDLSAEPTELRILVLHNRDFDPDLVAGGPLAEQVPPEHASRADVVNAARDVAHALVARGHFVAIQGTDRDDIPDLMQRLEGDRPDLVFNLCESLAGDGRHEIVVPALLDLLGIPYTGSGPLALALSLRKDRTKEILHSAGVPTPRAVVLPAASPSQGPDLALVHERELTYPLIIKPTREDASVGISAASVVHGDEQLMDQVSALRRAHRQPLLCEEFISGREIYASLLGDPAEVLPLHEIDFSRMPEGRPHIVCYRAKWEKGSIEYAGTPSGPAGYLPPVLKARVEQAARAAFAALDLSDYGRCDIRLSESGVPYVLEVNPNCDLSDGAGFSVAARLAGLSYDQLIERVAYTALRRARQERALLLPGPDLHSAELVLPRSATSPPRRQRQTAR